ncbi:hypothetical protein ACTG9Q_01220 [Actinokineospora sp. 24-640]
MVGRIDVWGDTDRPGLGEQVLARVAADALARAGARPRVLAQGAGVDGGQVTVAAAAGDAALTVVAVARPLGAADDPRPAGPLVWSGVRVGDVSRDCVRQAREAVLLAVRDEGSAARLRAAGVDREITVVPHPAIAADRLVDPATLPERVRQLRILGYLPAEPDYAVTDPALRERVDGATVVLPEDLVLEDRLAILSAARIVVTADEHTRAAAAAFGVPSVRWAPGDPGDPGDPDGSPNQAASVEALARRAAVPDLAAERARLDAHFAAVAALIEDDDTARTRLAAVVAENAALRTAHARLRERQLIERKRLAEPMADLGAERERLRDELDRLRAENAALRARAEHAEAAAAVNERELRAWQDTKLVRWSKPLRSAYGKVSGR